MKISIIVVCFLASAVGAFAQQPVKATTEDGRELLIYPDGTWRRLLASPGEQTAAQTTARAYQKPKDAKLFVKAARGNFGIWINQEKWKQDSAVDAGGIRIIFNHKTGEAYAMMISERLQVTTETLKKIALSNAKDAAPDAHIISEEKRVINGKEIICLKIAGVMHELPFVYYGYYYGGPEGSLQVLTYTNGDLFEEFKADFEEFLNGTQIGP